MQYRNKPKKQQVIRDNIDSCKRRIKSKRHFYDYVRIYEKRKRISFESEEEQSQDKEYIAVNNYTTSDCRLSYVTSNSSSTSISTDTSPMDSDMIYLGYSGIRQSGSTSLKGF